MKWKNLLLVSLLSQSTWADSPIRFPLKLGIEQICKEWYDESSVAVLHPSEIVLSTRLHYRLSSERELGAHSDLPPITLLTPKPLSLALTQELAGLETHTLWKRGETTWDEILHFHDIPGFPLIPNDSLNFSGWEFLKQPQDTEQFHFLKTSKGRATEVIETHMILSPSTVNHQWVADVKPNEPDPESLLLEEYLQGRDRTFYGFNFENRTLLVSDTKTLERISLIDTSVRTQVALPVSQLERFQEFSKANLDQKWREPKLLPLTHARWLAVRKLSSDEVELGILHESGLFESLRSGPAQVSLLYARTPTGWAVTFGQGPEKVSILLVTDSGQVAREWSLPELVAYRTVSAFHLEDRHLWIVESPAPHQRSASLPRILRLEYHQTSQRPIQIDEPFRKLLESARAQAAVHPKISAYSDCPRALASGESLDATWGDELENQTFLSATTRELRAFPNPASGSAFGLQLEIDEAAAPVSSELFSNYRVYDEGGRVIDRGEIRLDTINPDEHRPHSSRRTYQSSPHAISTLGWRRTQSYTLILEALRVSVRVQIP
jgi:hypothetical protein